MAPSNKQKAPKGGSGSSSISDPRFANIATDPRFRLPSKKHSRVKLDPRFARIVKDDSFSRKAKVDRYGRPLDSNKEKARMQKMYELDEEEDEDEADDDDLVRKELKRAGAYDPARDGGFSESSSSSESESESEEDEEEVNWEAEEDEAELPDQEEVPMGEVTKRLAAVNMDWDNIRAADLMAVASSFCPPSGRIESVTVYPSEFGRERIEREELEGPPKEIFANSKRAASPGSDSEADDEQLDDEDEEDRIKKSLLREDKGEEFDSTALRSYQLQRLRYYYAVIVCSTPETAKALYDNMDSREYLSSANFFDLRFVPDDTSFEDDKPRDACTSLPDTYRPTEFVTDALTHSNVRLTWDEDDKERKEVQKRAFTNAKEIEANDLAAYIGSDSSDDDGDDDVDVDASTSAKQSKAAALRAALGLTAEPVKSSKKKDVEEVGNMQVTFSAGLSGNKGGSVFENEPMDEETTIEKYKRKEKERKAKRKERAKARRDGVPLPEETAESTKDEVKESEAADEDDPFNDPFFDDPDGPAALAAKKAAKRAEKERKRSEAAAKQAATASERAKLELLITDDKDTNLRHFDMDAIAKAEKHAKKRGKKGKKAAEEVQQDDFQMDVQDPRFKKLFESHEYAIDPTNPRFKRTKGMEALLEEGRKRKDRGGDEGEERVRKGKKQRKGDGADDLRALAEKVKRKSKAKV